LINQEKIKKVKGIFLSNNIYYLEYCYIEPFAVEELARGNWQSLLSVTFCHYIIMKIQVGHHLEMRSADKWQR